MATLEDVARDVGCSVATVSRALNDHPRISDATRARVHEAATRLGYRGNALLRATLQRQKTIGLVIPSIRNSHYYDDASLLHDVLSADGYKIILSCHNNDEQRDGSILDALIRNPVDGIIHTPCTPRGCEDLLPFPSPVPIVELGSRAPSQLLDVICADEEGAVRDLVQHLAELGHRRIALLTGRKELHHIRARTDAYHRALLDAGLPKRDCPVVYGPSSSAWFTGAMHDLLGEPNRPTAAILANKPALLGAFAAVREFGLEVPIDISFASFTSEDWHAIVTPALTSYVHPFQEMGLMAAEVLRKRIEPDEDGDAPPRLIRFSGEIVERASTALAPTEETMLGEREAARHR